MELGETPVGGTHLLEVYRPFESGWMQARHGLWANRGDFLIIRTQGLEDDRCLHIGDLIHRLHRSLARASPYELPIPVPPQYVENDPLTAPLS